MFCDMIQIETFFLRLEAKEIFEHCLDQKTELDIG